MKKMRRFAAIAAAAAMTACMAMPMMTAWAAEGEITFDSETVGKHTYTAYKIFNGTVDEEDGSLQGISWAITGADAAAVTTNIAAFVTALKGDQTVVGVNNNGTTETSDDTNITLGSLFAACTNEAPSIASVLKTFENKSDEAEAFAKFVAAHTANLPATPSADGVISLPADPEGDTDGDSNDGYYVVVETGFKQDAANGGGAVTAHLLGVYDASAGAELDVKSSIPVVEKKVLENAKAITGTATYETTTEKWNDVADYNIGDAVPFKLYGTMPSTIDDYESYFYRFTDTLAEQFTLEDDVAFTIKVDGVEVTANPYNIFVETSGGNTTANTIVITFEDIKALTAKDGGAEIAITKDSVVTVEYEATLNANAKIGLPGQENEVYLEYSNNPNIEYSPNTSSSEKTDVNDKEVPETPDDSNGPDDDSNISKTIIDKVIVFTYELDVTKVDAATKKALKDAEFVLYRNSTGESGTVTEYAILDGGNKVSDWTQTKGGATVLKSDANGLFKVIGLDDGKYYLEETKQPDC
ncbi:MAG: isopeptide-forming domain-containing fimbrial protein, partial [Oscillospiraceae bacterium]|nr:isopeptide-forming domain-containing fimbrial protein [Oscillospiraceae bacterium]